MSAISEYITTIRNAIYGEQVRNAIANAIEACYSDVENPDLQSAAFLEAIEEAYENGVLDITEVTQVSSMTNENIVYRYMGTEAGYTANTLYFHNGSAWVPIGSGIRTAATAAQMTDTGAIYKYTGNESGYTANALYFYNGTNWVLVGSDASAYLVDDVENTLGTTMEAPVLFTGNISAGFSESNKTGTVTSSTATTSFYFPCEEGKCYRMNVVGSAVNSSVFIGAFSSIPAVGSSTTNYRIKTGSPVDFSIIPKSGETYILCGVGLSKDSNKIRIVCVSDESRVISTVDLGQHKHWELNGINTIDGKNDVNSKRIRTKEYIRVSKGDTIVSNESSYRLYYYNKDKSYVGSSGETFLSSDSTISIDGFVRLSIKVPDSVITVDNEEIDSLIDGMYIYKGERVFQSLQSISQEIGIIKEKTKTGATVPVGEPYVYLSEAIEHEDLSNKTVSDVYAIYDDLVENYPEFISRKSDVTEEPSGMEIRMYNIRLQNPVAASVEGSWESQHNIYSSTYDDFKKIFVHTGIHGDEKTSVFGIALAIKDIVESNDDWARYIRGNFSIDVIPVLNPYGFNHNQRKNYNNVDLNRDWLTRNETETSAVYELFRNGGYKGSLDGHNNGDRPAMGYVGTNADNPQIVSYVQMVTKLAGVLCGAWKNLVDNQNYSPYIQFFFSADGRGIFQDMAMSLGIPSVIFETTPAYNGIGNSKATCQATKDMFVNLLISIGNAEGLT